MLNECHFDLLYFPSGIPHDDLQELFRRIRCQSKTKPHAILRDFLEHATCILHEEFRRLPRSLRTVLPPLSNALDLAELSIPQRGPLAGAVEGVLSCLLHIASLIGYYESHPEQYAFSHSTTCFTGIGVSLLAAAAVAASPALSELPKLGAEAIRIAFRMGVLVHEKSQCIESQEPGSEPLRWAAAVMDLDEETVRKELETFNISTCSSVPSQLFISAGGDDNITISGPPSKLRKVFQTSKLLRSARYAHLPVYGGLCHAPHIYNAGHVALILETTNSVVVDRKMINSAPLLSTGNGEPLQGTTPRNIFESVVHGLLTDSIRWNMARDGALRSVKSAGVKCHVYAFRPCAVVADLVASGVTKAPQCTFETRDLMEWIFDPQSDTSPLRQRDSKIAIVGMSCRMPGGANDLQSFWDILQEGRDVHQRVPTDRYNVDSHTDPSGATRNTSLTPFGCFINQPGLFDAGFFDMSPREASQTDPMHRLALLTAYEALEQSGFVADRTESTDRRGVATFYGQSCDDYREANSGQKVDTYFIPGGCRAFAPGRINYFFKFSGPSFDCDTACSSSLATIQIACTSLLHGESNMVVAGGLNILTNSDGFAGLSRGHFLSKTGGCKTFDCDADGYCRADGIGSIVMKRLDDAERDNDNILGIILGSATNHSADAISITHPHAPTQASLYSHVTTSAGVNPIDVDFVEMHGTGTQAGDAAEMESVTTVFSPRAPKRTRKQPLYIGSVKANVGHGEAAAGIMALIKVLLTLQKDIIPKHVGIKTGYNPKLPDLDPLNVRIPFEQVPWPRNPTRKRYAVVNNFSAAGGNTTLLLEEPPLRSQCERDPRTAFTIAISAKSKISLKKNLHSLLAYIKSMPSENLASLSYTTTARRMHHNHRIAVSGGSPETIIQELEKYLPTVETHRPIESTPVSLAFVFSGQGTFYVGIGCQLYEHRSDFRKRVLQLNDICLGHGFPSFLGLITGGDSQQESDLSPIVTHLAIVCISIALCWEWENLGVEPCAVVGASLGEFAALYAAGVLSASDAIYLVGERARLIEELCTPNTHAMLAVRATIDQIDEALAGTPYEVACFNGIRDITLSGSVEDIARIRLSIEDSGYICTELNVPYAFHSAQMDPILDQYEKICGGVTFKEPKLPVISPLMGGCVFDGSTFNPLYMRNATRNPVHFVDSLSSALDLGLVDAKTVWVEVGPHAAYSHFVRKVMPEGTITVASLKRDEDNFHTFARGMAELHSLGLKLDWQSWHAPFESQLRLLDLPAYQWNLKNYWLPYNGTWMLAKDDNSSHSYNRLTPFPSQTALVQDLVQESIAKDRAEVTVQSDILQPGFWEAMNGHRMNQCAVATSSIHADVAFTLSNYLHSRMRPNLTVPVTNIKNMQVKQGLIARKDRSRPQWIQVHAVADGSTGSVQLFWYALNNQGQRAPDCFATAIAEWGDPVSWHNEWAPTAHLVLGRIETLRQEASVGKANRLSQDLTYSLFGNLVDYAEKYRGMQSVVLHGMEATAEITLTANERPDQWTVPPFHIDSVAHLAGFILNGGNALDSRKNFYVTPGWKSMRFARPLVAGDRYVSYVKMMPIHKQPGFFEGNVFIIQGDTVIGLVEGITFRSFPRLLLDEFFSPPDLKGVSVCQEAVCESNLPGPQASAALLHPEVPPRTELAEDESENGVSSTPPTQVSPQDSSTVNPIVQQAMVLISTETEIDLHELTNETEFASIGVDSLMSLVLAQKFGSEFKLEVRSSLFLDCPTIGDFKAWLMDYC
ncbi:polyketide synthase [Penicillium robsamsonii]|uniref:polyketide synthase n=1 Tax=Penicillium robsamsonii TaxID=1792511 RepID=UPI00254964F9|nr:polyketide synthase [Penicillium robsamsonii]KAJ5810983.1 polyketide synthase [Penicillium robsamsonii]